MIQRCKRCANCRYVFWDLFFFGDSEIVCPTLFYPLFLLSTLLCAWGWPGWLYQLKAVPAGDHKVGRVRLGYLLPHPSQGSTDASLHWRSQFLWWQASPDSRNRFPSLSFQAWGWEGKAWLWAPGCFVIPCRLVHSPANGPFINSLQSTLLNVPSPSCQDSDIPAHFSFYWGESSSFLIILISN